MKKYWVGIAQGLPEIGCVAALMVLFLVMMRFLGLPTGQELYLIEGAREAFYHHHTWYPTFNQSLVLPVSPLLGLIFAVVFVLIPQTIWAAKLVVLSLAGLALIIFYHLGSRLFHAVVGAVTAGLLIGTWGFFNNALTANGAVLYTLEMGTIFWLFFDWFDSGFRSRTYARSLIVHFIGLGILLGLAFATYGLPGFVFPVGVMVTTIALSTRWERLQDIRLVWLIVPLGIVLGGWTLFCVTSFGLWPFLCHLFYIGLGLRQLLLPVAYALPLLPLLIPALANKDIWSRALLTHQRPIWLLGAWTLWAGFFLLICPSLHAAFALLMLLPSLIWLSYTLNEIFRNPMLPPMLHYVIDGLILLGLLMGVACVFLTLQLVPPSMKPGFTVLTYAFPLLSIILLVLKERATSRFILLALIPYGLLVCFLIKMTFAPLFPLQPDAALAQYMSRRVLRSPHAAVVEWQEADKSGSFSAPAIRIRVPLKNKVLVVTTPAQLEATLQTRQGPLYLILPEPVFYALPATVQGDCRRLATAWRWKKPLTLAQLMGALGNETVDFTTLSQPVFLLYLPTPDASD